MLHREIRQESWQAGRSDCDMKLLPDTRVQLFQGDSFFVLDQFEDESIDAVITDPPAGISFMNKEWDHHKGGRDQWIQWLSNILKECYRVMKPGAYALVWALPRTSHWTGMAIEDAGFIVRDVITHHFGSGFPKSLNIGKGMDKAAGATRKIVGDYARGKEPYGYSTSRVESGYRPNVTRGSGHITAPTTDAAKQWEGWGTALKPASEHWILARKPFEGSLTQNVLTHGTGALNIDACRVGSNKRHPGNYHDQGNVGGERTTGKFSGSDRSQFKASQGRWPANLILSDDAPEELGEAGRFFYCPKPSRREREAGLEDFESKTVIETVNRRPESAGVQNPRAGAGRGAGTPIYKCSWCGLNLQGGRAVSRCTNGEAHEPELVGYGASVKNHHPTVKSITLMRYLTKLITPPNGIVLDPFMGSGSTGCACVLEGFQFRGIELDNEYVAMSRARINYWKKQLDR
jgi:DNA modification methylase